MHSYTQFPRNVRLSHRGSKISVYVDETEAILGCTVETSNKSYASKVMFIHWTTAAGHAACVRVFVRIDSAFRHLAVHREDGIALAVSAGDDYECVWSICLPTTV